MPTSPPVASVNLLADTVFANGLGADPTGLLKDAEDTEDFDAVDDLLPLHQRMSHVMVSAHAAVDQQAGQVLASLSLAELQALKTQATLREKQLLTTRDPAELFAPIDPNEHGFTDAVIPDTANTSPPEDEASDDGAPAKLSLTQYAQIRQEATHLDEIVTTRATADLVKLLRQPGMQIEIPGRRQAKTPLTAATSFVATILRCTYSAVDKRITAAASIWPDMNYRRSTLTTPRLAAQLEQGRIPLATAVAAHDKLSDMRQAVRRAGGDDATADDLVRHQERDFVHHAVRNNPHTFTRYATASRDAVTNELIGPRQSLTEDQLKHEKGLFYAGPVGENLHSLTAVVDEAELLQLHAIREFATKLDSAVSLLTAQSHEDSDTSTLSPDNQHAADDVANNPRITPEDLDVGIGQLFDGQTKAERWLNTMLDFLSAGLILHKTYDPHATEEDQHRRDTALHKAAEHSDVLADILGMDAAAHDVVESHDVEHSPSKDPPETLDPLAPFIPPGYQLLRPNLDMIVEISLRDLVGAPPDAAAPEATNDDAQTSEIVKIVERLKHQEGGFTTPTGSPGNVTIDYGLARQQACTNRIIPMVLDSASQPLDVGRAQRSFPAAIRRALHVRDRGCIVPGCPRPASWCQPHHLEDWAKGGPTALLNAGLLCRAHHRAVHKKLLVIHMEDDGLPSCSLPVAQDPTQTRYRNVYWHR